MNPLVRRASPGDLAAAARLLANAFDTYPWTRWSIPEADYANRLERLQYLYLGHALEHGMLLVDDEVRSVAAFLPPETPELPETAQLQIAELLGDRLNALGQLSLPEMPANAWTLATVGVDPAHQGAGLGTQVVASGLDVIDRAGGTVALETSDERNVRLYQRLGFATTATTAIPDGPVVYSMMRPSSPAAPEQTVSATQQS